MRHLILINVAALVFTEEKRRRKSSYILIHQSPLYFALDSSSFVVIDSCVGTLRFFSSWRDTGKTGFWTPRLSGYGLLRA